LTLEARELLKATIRNPVVWGAIREILADRAAHALAVQDKKAMQVSPNVVRIAALTAERRTYENVASKIELEAMRT
jgi:hypothetical protein